MNRDKISYLVLALVFVLIMIGAYLLGTWQKQQTDLLMKCIDSGAANCS